MNKFQNVTDKPSAPPAPATYADRQFLHTFLAGALLPLVQAVITAVMVGLGTMTLLLLFDAVDVVKPTLVVAAIACVLSWLYLQRRWLTLTSLELLTGLDLNNDKQIGEPVKASPVVRIQIDQLTNNGHIQQTKMFDLPISEEKLRVLANGLLNGVPFSEREWTTVRRLLSSQGFRDLRSQMLRRGLLEVKSDKDHRVGFHLTEHGWAVMRQFNPSHLTPDRSPKGEGKTEGRDENLRGLTDEELDAIERENEQYSNQFSKGDLT